MIPFNKPHLSGKEAEYISDAVNSGKLSGNGKYTKLCHDLLEGRYGFGKCLLTTSCTDALEMAAILIDIEKGDEVIMPSYTFTSTANAFVLRGAKIVFVDCRDDHPGMNEESIEELITPVTKAIVPVHYAGVACDMDKILELAKKYGLYVIEDAAQAIDNYYIGRTGNQQPLGTLGHMSTFSFHETKNIISGEGGMLAINSSEFNARSEIIWEKGTNRSAFFRNEVDKYGWVDIGSSFLPSELGAAFLYAQLESIERIQRRRKEIWNKYFTSLSEWAISKEIKMPVIPKYSGNNYHLFYLVCRDQKQRDTLISHLKSKNVMAVFHYLSLHKSEFFTHKHDGRALPLSDHYSECLLRLPMYFDLTTEELEFVISEIISSPI